MVCSRVFLFLILILQLFLRLFPPLGKTAVFILEKLFKASDMEAEFLQLLTAFGLHFLLCVFVFSTLYPVYFFSCSYEGDFKNGIREGWVCFFPISISH